MEAPARCFNRRLLQQYLPKADIRAAANWSLLDHLVGEGEQRLGHRKTHSLRRLEVDHQFVLGWRLHRQVGWLLALEDAVHVAGGKTKLLGTIGTIGNKAPRCGEVTLVVDRGQSVPCG